jgi:hypothetical protein
VGPVRLGGAYAGFKGSRDLALAIAERSPGLRAWPSPGRAQLHRGGQPSRPALAAY